MDLNYLDVISLSSYARMILLIYQKKMAGDNDLRHIASKFYYGYATIMELTTSPYQSHLTIIFHNIMDYCDLKP